MQNPIIQQVIETLRGANSVLITVKNSPSVDELTAAISLTLILNHMEKNATTVFSGQVPSTIEFLQPDMAIEQNTDSLRDFIIALDKAKADKLRYKVEDNVVRIFITPYKASITEEDLEFSQGDLNVDVVVTLGVLSKDDFDEAIVSHGRILHDATVVSISSGSAPLEIGTVNWQDNQASGVSEMIASITDVFGPDVVDNQIATALLTGIVSETGRFKNEKTTPQVLALSSKLMAAGANQQLIAEKLEQLPSHTDGLQPMLEEPVQDDSISIPKEEDSEETSEKIAIDQDGNLMPMADDAETADDATESTDGSESDEPQEEHTEEAGESVVGERVMLSAPAEQQEQDDPSESTADPSGLFGNSLHDVSSGGDEQSTGETHSALEGKTLEKEKKVIEPPDHSDDGPQFILDPIPESNTATEKPDGEQTLRDLEKSVHSPHLDKTTPDPASNIEEYMGSAIPVDDEEPPAQEDAVTPTQEDVVTNDESGGLPSLPGALDAPVPKYEAPEEPEPKIEEEQPNSEIPEITQPSDDADDQPSHDEPTEAEETDAPKDEGSAPSVPPPILPNMPQADGDKQPLFYEADGSKSNPFVNP